VAVELRSSGHYDQGVELKETPEVERWPADAGRFIVAYGYSGGWWTEEGEQELEVRMAELGIDEVLLTHDTITLYGVSKGSETAVHEALTAVIAAEERRRTEAAEEYERSRPEREAEEARRESELEEVRNAFRRASSDTTA
jgi:hypothetical protein